jgi:hypothetical protein
MIDINPRECTDEEIKLFIETGQLPARLIKPFPAPKEERESALDNYIRQHEHKHQGLDDLDALEAQINKLEHQNQHIQSSNATLEHAKSSQLSQLH